MFTINEITWQVIYEPKSSNKLRRSDGVFVLGVCDNNEHRIYIYDGLHDALLKKVLTHEIVHASMNSYGVDLSVEQEELVADLIATYGDEIIEISNRIFYGISEMMV